MKTIYSLFCFALISFTTQAQTYELKDSQNKIDSTITITLTDDVVSILQESGIKIDSVGYEQGLSALLLFHRVDIYEADSLIALGKPSLRELSDAERRIIDAKFESTDLVNIYGRDLSGMEVVFCADGAGGTIDENDLIGVIHQKGLDVNDYLYSSNNSYYFVKIQKVNGYMELLAIYWGKKD